MTRLLPLLLLASCSLGTERPGPDLRCEAADCPDLAEVERVMIVFRDVAASTFNPHDTLRVYWYDEGYDFGFHSGRGGRVIGYTPEPDEVHVTNMRVFGHELMHVHLWRIFPESYGDADHEAGEGPWTEATNDAVRAVLAEAGY